MFVKRCRYYRLLILLLLFPLSLSAMEEEIPFNAKEAIFKHLGDEYGWTIELPNDYSMEIVLPIIVRDCNGKWYVFSSEKLKQEGGYDGFYIASQGDNEGKIEALDSAGNVYRPIDLSITKNVLALFICALLVALTVIHLARWYKRNGYNAPRKAIGGLEMVVDMIYTEMIVAILGKEAKRYAPYLLTIFFFILFANLLSLIVIFPGGANLMGNISITMVLAVCTFFVVNISGTKHYWREIFWPDVPLWLKFPIPILPIIEVFGIFTKSAALMIRLFANLLGGHLIILVLISLIFMFGLMGPAVLGTTTVMSVLFSLFMRLIDLLISFIQAYVFTMLSTLFICLARAKK